MNVRESCCMFLGFVAGFALATCICLGCLVSREWFILPAVIGGIGGFLAIGGAINQIVK